MKRHSPQPRQFRVHMTSVIVSAVRPPSYAATDLIACIQDTKATAVTLGIGTSNDLLHASEYALTSAQSKRASCRRTSAPWS